METRRCQALSPFGKSARDDPTPRAPPPRRVGARGPATTRLREAAGRALRCEVLRLARSAAARMRRLRGRIRGRGPHHPLFREEDRDPPHPRCLPSMSRPPSSALRWSEPVPRLLAVRVGTSPARTTGGTVCFPQFVANLWRTSDVFFNLAGSAALDGATGRRPGGVSGGSKLPPSCQDGASPKRGLTSRQVRLHGGELQPPV